MLRVRFESSWEIPFALPLLTMVGVFASIVLYIFGSKRL
jgi:hypothetical protein